MAGSTRFNLLWNTPFGTRCLFPVLQDCWRLDVVCGRRDLAMIIALQWATLWLKNQFKFSNGKGIERCFFYFGNPFP